MLAARPIAGLSLVATLGVVVVLLAGGCRRSDPPLPITEAMRAAFDTDVPLDDAIARCAAIPQDPRAAACAFDAVVNRGMAGVGGCAQVPQGPWQDECRFRGAQRTDLPLARRYALCAKATRVREACELHVAQDDIQRSLVHAGGGIATAVEVEPLLEAHLAHGPARIDDFSMEDWIWFQLWRTRFSRQLGGKACEAADRAECEEVTDPAHREACLRWFDCRVEGPRLGEACRAWASCGTGARPVSDPDAIPLAPQPDDPQGTASQPPALMEAQQGRARRPRR